MSPPISPPGRSNSRTRAPISGQSNNRSTSRLVLPAPSSSAPGSGPMRSLTATFLSAASSRSAEHSAHDSGAEVGRIKTASQGYFSVGARDGDDCDDCGSSGESSPFQKVRVVTTIDYDLG